MKSYPLHQDETGLAVLEIGKMNFEGNVIPHSWFENLRFEGGKPHLPAIILLSDIVYWYRPVEIRDEFTGKRTGRAEKKFAGRYLQRDIGEFGAAYGLSYKQARDALQHLHDAGIITKHTIQGVITGKGKALGNVHYVQLHPEALEAITYDRAPNGLPLCPTGQRVCPVGQTITEQSPYSKSEREEVTGRVVSSRPRNYRDELAEIENVSSDSDKHWPWDE